jgi:hypothetical protein
MLPENDGGPVAVASVITIVFGLLLVLVAQRLWHKRPAKGEHGTLPKWMSAIDSMSPVKGFALGFLLAAVPKNLLLDGSAGLIIGSAPLSLSQDTAVITIFTVLAACTVLIPVIGYLIAPTRMVGPLETLRESLVDDSATIMSISLLVIGISMIGNGIGGL